MGRKIILVCGPGRSGTSLLMSVLHDLGVLVSDDMVPPGPWNERGYWEDRRIVELHKKLLEEFGNEGFAGSTVPQPDDWQSHPKVAATGKAIAEHVNALFEKSDLVGFKNPRISTVLPLWYGLVKDLGAEIALVVSVRHPLSVSKSMHVITRAPTVLGEQMWLNRMAHIVRDAKGHFIVVHFEDMIADSQKCLGDLAAFVYPDDAVLRKSALVSAIGASRADPSLVHAAPDGRFEIPLCRAFYEVLRPLNGSIPVSEELRRLSSRFFRFHRRNPEWRTTTTYLQRQLSSHKRQVRNKGKR